MQVFMNHFDEIHPKRFLCLSCHLHIQFPGWRFSDIFDHPASIYFFRSSKKPRMCFQYPKWPKLEEMNYGNMVLYVINITLLTSRLPDSTASENQFIEVSSAEINKSIIIGNIHRPPRENLEKYNTFIEELNILLSSCDRSNHEIVICGDFNRDLLKKRRATNISCLLRYNYV